MTHLPSLINDLAIILIVAAATTLIFRLIKQPVVLGYIIAGFLVGPNFALIPTISEEGPIKIWAELGVIFLLFGLGLEFNFKKLKDLGGPSLITGLIEVSIMLAIGYLTGRFLGWPKVDCLFLGGILSISSTTIIIRAFDELGVKTQHFASLVFGILVIEDLVAILLLVLLSTIAVTNQFEGADLIYSSGKLLFFIILWFIGGIFFVPTIIRSIKRYLSDEMLLVISLALCLTMVLIATHAGFSAALGSFVMGSLLSESQEGKRIEHLIQPLKDFFGSIFFVSVGMLINPKVLIEHWDSVFIITIVLIISKIIGVTFGCLIAGKSLKNSIQTGFSLAQIGEFSFIIATLGLTLKVTSDILYPLAVGTSVITAFTTPYLIKYSSGIAQKLEILLPIKVTSFINNYSSSTQNIQASNKSNELIKRQIIKTLILVFILVAIALLSKQFMIGFFKEKYLDKKFARHITLVIVIILSAPFYWALLSKNKNKDNKDHFSNKEVLVNKIIMIFRYFMNFAAMTTQSFILIPSPITASIIVLIFAILFHLFSNELGNIYNWFEEIFNTNLTNTNKKEIQIGLLPWEAHLTDYSIPQESPFIGKTLEELKIRENYGVTIVLIKRGRIKIKSPSRSQIIYPFDIISVIGTDEQLSLFEKNITTLIDNGEISDRSDYELVSYLIPNESPFVDKSIRESSIRETTDGLIVGLERDQKRTINPESNIKLQAGDLLWIVGDRIKLKNLTNLN